MIKVKITFDNNNYLNTSFDGTELELREFYLIGKLFDVGDDDEEVISKVKKVEVLKQWM